MADSTNGPVRRLGWAQDPLFDVTGKVLMGLIRAPEPEARRRPDSRVHIDVEIHGRNSAQRLESTLDRVSALVESIDDLRAAAEQMAPAEWRSEHLARSDYAGLWLEGFEFHDNGIVRVLFDFGDLDLLTLDLHPNGHRAVSIEP